MYAIIGAGAAGCFCAIELKRRHPDVEVVVLEKATKALAKVAITGGGRCNLTNSFVEVRSMEKVYPRGHKLMKRVLKVFSNEDTMRWFEREGVRLVIQDDQCVFPQSQDAMEIVNTLTRLMQCLGVKVVLNSRVLSLSKAVDGYTIATADREYHAEKVIITTGGAKNPLPFDINLGETSLKTLDCIPALFTFNVADNDLHSLMGTVVENVSTHLSGTKFQAEGPVLITHWGLSGPAILKLSSYGARYLAERDYQAEVGINWFSDKKEPEVLQMLNEMAILNPRKQLSNVYPEQFCQRHWLYILNKVALPAEKRWSEVGTKQMNRLASLLTNDTYKIVGKGQFKEEFVTCGGVALENINMNTMECKQHPGLYFAGEVLDVDAITGGFNLQAAWTMGMIAAKGLNDK